MIFAIENVALNAVRVVYIGWWMYLQLADFVVARFVGGTEFLNIVNSELLIFLNVLQINYNTIQRLTSIQTRPMNVHSMPLKNCLSSICTLGCEVRMLLAKRST